MQEFLEIVKSNPYIQYLTVLNGITGLSLVALASGLLRAIRDKKSLKRSKAELVEEIRTLRKDNARLQVKEEEYENFLEEHEADYGNFLKCIPDNEDQIAALVLELIEGAFEIKKTEVSESFYDSRWPVSRRFMNSVSVFLSVKYLIRSPKFDFSRILVAQQILEETLASLWFQDQCEEGTFLNRDRVDDLGNIMSRIDLLWRLSEQDKKIYVKDYLLCAKLIACTCVKFRTHDWADQRDEIVRDIKKIEDENDETLKNCFLARILLFCGDDLPEDLQGEAIEIINESSQFIEPNLQRMCRNKHSNRLNSVH